jgi:hypothetical protein
VSAEPAADDGFDPELLAYAEQFGYTKDDFATPMQLTKALASLHKMLARSAGQETQQPIKPEPAPAPQPAAAQKAKYEFKVPEALLDKSQYDPEVVAFAESVKQLNDHYQGKFSEVEQLRGLVAEQLTTARQQQTERYFDDVDKLFVTDEAMAEVFGQGTRHDLRHGPALESRRAMIDQMGIVAGVFHQQGKPVPATDKLYAMAKAILHSDKTEQIARRQIADRLRNNKGQFTAAPVHKPKGELPHGPDRAVSALAKHMKENRVFDTDIDTGLAA